LRLFTQNLTFGVSAGGLALVVALVATYAVLATVIWFE
jgi:hypothetical protein